MASIAEDLRGTGDVDVSESLACASLALAKRLAAAATLWCLSPEWPEHARHVAVEFVHPVLVGKRALPAVSVESADPAVALRPLVRAGDVILAVSPLDSPVTMDVMRRAAAWGAMTMWIGTGAPPPTRAADHVLRADPDSATGRIAGGATERSGQAAHDGRLVVLYHVLWELTHVCFEHPGLLTPPDKCAEGEICITCSDEGRVGEVIAADDIGHALVRTAAGVESIDLTLIDDVVCGDLVLIHAGTAIAVLS